MKFETDEGNVRIIHVEITNDAEGKTYLIFDFDNGVKQTIPCHINLDYITVVRNLVKRKHE